MVCLSADLLLALMMVCLSPDWPGCAAGSAGSATIGVLTLTVMLLWDQFKGASHVPLPAPLVGIFTGSVCAFCFGVENIKFIHVPPIDDTVHMMPLEALSRC